MRKDTGSELKPSDVSAYTPKPSAKGDAGGDEGGVATVPRAYDRERRDVETFEGGLVYDTGGEDIETTPRKRTSRCTITFSNASSGSPKATGFAPQPIVSGTPVPNAQTGRLLVATTRWQNFAISAERNFILSFTDAIAALVRSVSTAGTGQLRQAIADAIAALDPLLNGRVMTYVTDVGFSFAAEATKDGDPDEDAQFEVRHSASFLSGISSAAGQSEIHWELTITAAVDQPCQELTLHLTDREADDKEFGQRTLAKPAPADPKVVIGTGTHVVNQRAFLELRVESFGAEVNRLIDVLRSAGDAAEKTDDFISALFNDQPIPHDLRDQLRDALTDAIKEVGRKTLEELKALLTKVTAEIDLKESYLNVECMAHRPAAAPAPSH